MIRIKVVVLYTWKLAVCKERDLTGTFSLLVI